MVPVVEQILLKGKTGKNCERPCSNRKSYEKIVGETQ